MSVSVIRGLLERNLVERAVALSETRWSGSGPLVRLAHEWGGLPPAERRDRLAAIGPEDLARLRGVADLQPDLARVLDDLETRGIIPPAAALTPDPDATMTQEEAVVDAVLDLAEERVTDFVAKSEIDMPAAVDEWRERVAAMQDGSTAPGSADAIARGEAARAFQQGEAERREAAAERGAEMLDRIRQRVEDSGARVATSTLGDFPGAAVAPVAVVASAPVIEALARRDEAIDAQSARADVLNAIMTERVYESASGAPPLAESELRSVATALGLGFVRIDGEQYSNREVYGGLVRKGRGVVEEAGFLPRALAGRNLVAFSGRLYPTALARIDDGFFDIPGTRAATRVHPDSRLVILG